MSTDERQSDVIDARYLLKTPLIIAPLYGFLPPSHQQRPTRPMDELLHHCLRELSFDGDLGECLLPSSCDGDVACGFEPHPNHHSSYF